MLERHQSPDELLDDDAHQSPLLPDELLLGDHHFFHLRKLFLWLLFLFHLLLP